jgi:anti-sigma regulatory factor (Ser/Thr protein kinase)
MHNCPIGHTLGNRGERFADRNGALETEVAGFEHQLLLHHGDDGFLSGSLRFIGEALDAGEPVLVAVTARRAQLLAEALAADAGRVAFRDMCELGANPARIIPAWQSFLDDHASHAGVLHGIGEPVWSGRTAAELDECRRHEQLLNPAFAGGRPWRLMCPYDLAELGEVEILAAESSHPYEAALGGVRARAGFRPVEDPFAGTLEPPPATALALDFDEGALAEVRRVVARCAAQARLAAERRSDLVLAVNELAANSVVHGGGSGTLRVWEQDRALICEIRDAGLVDSPLAGRLAPQASQLGGRGLWMVNQVCDLVQIRSSRADGTAMRVHMGLD